MRTTATCKNCGRVMVTSDMEKIDSPSKNYFFVCPACTETMERYSRENTQFVHGSKQHGYTLSFEFEVTDRPVEQNLLYQYNFMPSSDSTVECEWKSPVYKSLCGLAKMFRSIEDVSEDCLGDDASTHLNIGNVHFINNDNLDIIAKYYHKLFDSYTQYLEANPVQTEKLYGRAASDWAKFCHRIGYTEVWQIRDEHAIFANLQHDKWIEFRLCKFVNAAQFMACIKLHYDIVHCLGNFIEYATSGQYSHDELIHKAHVISGKMIRLFDKYVKTI